MMASADRWAVDTSIAVAALDAGHLAHEQCLAVVKDRRPALAGHAAFEVFSVLTRMPGELALDGGDAARLIQRVFPNVYWLSGDDSAALRDRLAVAGVAGRAVYDALVGEAARTNEATLVTRDRRAQRTYDLLGVGYELLP
ncbi:MAG: type II toxin-antitoxin system VapC family toxin [Propionibacteriaceae bacterium]|nr:type II toxin-antitoxin system VapC family toxin [Propionibacteriaceae bacterium]